MAQFRSVGGRGCGSGTHLHAGYGGRIDRQCTMRTASGSDGVWPLHASATGRYNDSSLSGVWDLDFDKSPATMSLALVPVEMGDFKRTDIGFNMTWGGASDATWLSTTDTDVAWM